MRSRAVSLPRWCWRSTAAALPACSACSRSSASCSSRSSIGWTGTYGFLDGHREPRLPVRAHSAPPKGGAGSVRQAVSCGCLTSSAWREPCWISTFRAFACSATGW